MKAAIYSRYGKPDVIHVKEVGTPEPSTNEIQVRVYASSITTADTMMRRGDPYFARFATGFPKPKVQIMGTGYAGEITALGEGVNGFNIGDSVFGETAMEFSANAEYVCVNSGSLIEKLPENLSYAEAAPLCDGALTAFNFLTCVAKLRQGQSLLINGASGSIGTAAIQIAKCLGAHVTAVCSEKNRELVLSLGADEMIDYQCEDFTQVSERYDIIFDTLGKHSFSDCKRVLKKQGEYISPVLSLPLLFHMLSTQYFGSKKAKFSATGLKSVEALKILMADLVDMIQQGKLRTVIDRKYVLNDIAQAHEYIEQGHKRGSVVAMS